MRDRKDKLRPGKGEVRNPVYKIGLEQEVTYIDEMEIDK